MTAALYAAKPQEKFFGIVKDKLELDAEQKERVIQVYTEMASAKPVPRTRGRRG